MPPAVSCLYLDLFFLSMQERKKSNKTGGSFETKLPPVYLIICCL